MFIGRGTVIVGSSAFDSFVGFLVSKDGGATWRINNGSPEWVTGVGVSADGSVLAVVSTVGIPSGGPPTFDYLR